MLISEYELKQLIIQMYEYIDINMHTTCHVLYSKTIHKQTFTKLKKTKIFDLKCIYNILNGCILEVF